MRRPRRGAGDRAGRAPGDGQNEGSGPPASPSRTAGRLCQYWLTAEPWNRCTRGPNGAVRLRVSRSRARVLQRFGAQGLAFAALGVASGCAYCSRGLTRQSSTDAGFFRSAFFLSVYSSCLFVFLRVSGSFRTMFAAILACASVRSSKPPRTASARTAPGFTGFHVTLARGLNCYGRGTIRAIL